MRPLDLAPLVHSHEATHLELARTVDELQQWMSVVEAGLTQMLDRPNQDTIEEEQEDVVVYDRSVRPGLATVRDDSFADGRTDSTETATPGSFAVPVSLE